MEYKWSMECAQRMVDIKKIHQKNIKVKQDKDKNIK